LPQITLKSWVRLIQLFPTAREAFASFDQQGYVPCEYHLIRWILTGKRPNIRQG